ncbi:MAG: hypothetical protein ABI142_09760, partial [Bryocella sp.]
EPRSGFSTGLGQLLLRCLNSGIHAVACPDEEASTSLSMPAARPVVPDSPPHRGPGSSSGPSWPALVAIAARLT